MSYPIEVLYEDNHLIAVVKPPGALIQADESDERCLMDDVKDYLKSKYQKPGNVFLGLIHRLDRNVTGIVVFAKTSKGASRLSEQFRKRDITKTYHALVEGHLERPHGTLINMLDKEEHKRIAYESPKGKEAKLSYKVIKELGENTLVEIELYTGRFHQIRGQTAYYPAGMPKDKEGTVMFTEIKIGDQWLVAMDSAEEHGYTFNEGVSLIVNCDSQEEMDYFYDHLSAVPEAEQCGWIKDKYGVSWQIVPREMNEMMATPDKEKFKRMSDAMLEMKRLDVEKLKNA